ncbi:MAG: hypothetical protein IM486_20370 [Microcystis sp. M114S2]|jgi:hypothetical protein|uniref:hypothetical protein n=1 Tax=unclassified Microcystis TaxID=2643300 RepID=UPI00258561B4|nr:MULTISPECIES: hypothetical protein [unclassified Microcystis]MCA2666174.1 hypothetical protein [Microcystis sp. M045S2]MCA2712765.1 hypothetical protein [Microcystis sp. M172S2]MCA2806300.1 hypothetical protein [Microcystis sp. M114S2]MCA2833713.1 hypothetical protein [Microcystis sp. M007S1]MCA2836384.1 hypothetical protein [Microcystis sp. M078S1]
MTTLLYYILKSRFWQRIVMTSPPNLGGEGDTFRVNLSPEVQKTGFSEKPVFCGSQLLPDNDNFSGLLRRCDR